MSASGKTHLDYCPGCKGPHRPLRMVIVSGKPRSDDAELSQGDTYVPGAEWHRSVGLDQSSEAGIPPDRTPGTPQGIAL